MQSRRKFRNDIVVRELRCLRHIFDGLLTEDVKLKGIYQDANSFANGLFRCRTILTQQNALSSKSL